MALNLWTTGGKPSSINPLPSTYTYGTSANSLNLPPSINVPNCNAVLSFWAYSPTNGVVNFNSTNVSKDFNLTRTRQFYSYILSDSRVYNHIDLTDKNSNGDIIIDSISLVQAPLAKNTINGLDGFLSGKWSISNNAVVSDDVTLHLNTASPWDNSALILPVLPNTTYNFSCFASSNGISLAGILVGWLDSNNVTINSGNDWACNTLSTSVTNISGSLTSPSNAVKVSVMLTSNGSGVFTFNKPMLNLGSIPAPYEPKRGDKMVLPTAKKNFIPSVSNFILESVGSLERENISDTKLRLKTLDGAVKYVDYSFDSLPNKQYTVSVGVNDGNMPVYSYNGSGYTVLATLSGEMKSATFTTPSDCKKIKINCETKTVVGDYFFDQIQLEQGTTATTFTPYAVQVNPKPKRVLNTIVKVKITLNNGIASLYINDVLDISDSGHNYTPLNTHAMGVASWSFSSSYFNGVILSASYYDGALQLFNYDFTNPRTVTGNTVLNSGNMNLLPSFDSGQWSIHANAKVLGKDTLHLDATGTFQTSSVLLDVIPNKNYVYYCNTNGTVRIYNGTTTSDSLLTASTGVSFTPTVGKILINIHNGSASTGSFDFIRPQLYQLDGTEGTVNGSPVLLKKSSARKLFAKR
jgi:hypothetical protein